MARRRERLDELANKVGQEYSVAVEVLPLDLSDSKARAKLADRLRSEPIAGLCNSAGFGTSGSFHELPVERESEEVTLNALALMELTHAALSGMVERGAGAVMNIASIAGFQPIPYMAVYSATKAFVQTFSEAVHEELHGTGVSVTCLCPGPVPTEWAEIANAERFSIPARSGLAAGRGRGRDRRDARRQAQRGARRGAQGRQRRRQVHTAQPAAARDPDRQPAARPTRPVSLLACVVVVARGGQKARLARLGPKWRM